MISLVLHKVKYEENIGYVARAMKNFGFKELILVNPQCEIGNEAMKRASHATEILKNAREFKNFDDFRQEFDFIIGTSAIEGKKPHRAFVTPRDLAETLKGKENLNIALVFGSEEKGLGNEILKKCSFNIRIPTSKDYGVLNLSHSVAIILYEIFLSNQQISENPFNSKNFAEKRDMLEKTLKNVLAELNYDGKSFERTYKGMLNLIYKSVPKNEEMDSIIMLMKRIESKLLKKASPKRGLP